MKIYIDLVRGVLGGSRTGYVPFPCVCTHAHTHTHTRVVALFHVIPQQAVPGFALSTEVEPGSNPGATTVCDGGDFSFMNGTLPLGRRLGQRLSTTCPRRWGPHHSCWARSGWALGHALEPALQEAPAPGRRRRFGLAAESRALATTTLTGLRSWDS